MKHNVLMLKTFLIIIFKDKQKPRLIKHSLQPQKNKAPSKTKKKVNKAECSQNFLARLSCNWQKKQLKSLADKKKYDGFECRHNLKKSFKAGKAGCPAAQRNFFEKFKNSLNILKHFKTHSVSKILKTGTEKEQTKMRNDIKSGLRKKALTVLVEGMKSCESIPELFRQKMQDFLDNVTEEIEEKAENSKSGKKTAFVKKTATKNKKKK